MMFAGRITGRSADKNGYRAQMTRHVVVLVAAVRAEANAAPAAVVLAMAAILD
jgi:hypothetical protein